MSSLSPLDFLDEFGEIIEKGLVEGPKNRSGHNVLSQAATQLIVRGGKRLRPAMCILAFRSVGGENVEAVLPLARAIEYVHTWTLIHDDIIDRSPLRRGGPTVNKRYGDEIAILAGDYLIHYLFELIGEATEQGKVPDSTAIKVIRILSEECINMVEGEMTDVEFSSKTDVSIDEYLKMIDGKTGALLKAAMKIGALAGEASPEVVDALGEYGRLVGMAFQIRDDVLDLVGETKETGKMSGGDIVEGKKTLILIHALANLDENSNRALFKIVGRSDSTDSEIQRAISILRKCGSVDFANQTAMRFALRAKDMLKPLRESKYKKSLTELADFVATRTR